MGNQQVLKKILDSDQNIRFVCIFDKYGTIKDKLYRDGLSPVLDEFDSEQLVQDAASSWKYRKYLSQKLGQGHYSITSYENLNRITIPIDEDLFILISTEETFESPPALKKTQEILEKNKIEPVTDILN